MALVVSVVVAAPLAASAGAAPVTLAVGSNQAVAGKATIPVVLHTNGAEVGGAQLDMQFDNTIIKLNSFRDCEINQAIGLFPLGAPPNTTCADDTSIGPCKSFTRGLANCGAMPTPPGCSQADATRDRFRGIVSSAGAPNLNTIPDGSTLFTCTFTVVDAGRLPTEIAVSNAVATDPSANRLDATATPGTVTASPPAMCNASVTVAKVTGSPTQTEVGDIERIRLEVNAGDIVGGTRATIRLLQFDLDCNRSAGEITIGQCGAGCRFCVDAGSVVAFRGNISSTCGAYNWVASPRVDNANRIMLEPQPIGNADPQGPSLAANESCTVSFDIEILAVGPGGSGGFIDQAALLTAPCDNGQLSIWQGGASLFISQRTPTPTTTPAMPFPPTSTPTFTPGSPMAVPSPTPTATHLPCGALSKPCCEESSCDASLFCYLETCIDPATFVCPGDCDDDGAVTIDELITVTLIAAGNAPISQCPAGDRNGDDQILVDEVQAAVNAILFGCPPHVPRPTATPTRTAGRSTATPTPTPSRTPTRTPSQPAPPTFTSTPVTSCGRYIFYGQIVTASFNFGAVAGVDVEINGQKTTTDSSGGFRFSSVEFCGPQTMTVSRPGKTPVTFTIPAPPAGYVGVSYRPQRRYEVDISFQDSTPPVVTDIKQGFFDRDLNGIHFKESTGLLITDPLLVDGPFDAYYAFSVVFSDTATSGVPRAHWTLNGTQLPEVLDPHVVAIAADQFRVGENTLTVSVRDGELRQSNVYQKKFTFIGIPAPIRALLGPLLKLEITHSDGVCPIQYGLDFEVPSGVPFGASLDLPIVGQWGVEIGVNGGFDYCPANGKWELGFGHSAEFSLKGGRLRDNRIAPARPPKAKFNAGEATVDFSVDGLASGVANLQQGITLREAMARIQLALKLLLAEKTPLDLLAPESSEAIKTIPGLENAMKKVKLQIWFNPAFDASSTLGFNPGIIFKHLEVTGTAAVEAVLDVDLSVADLTVTVGGKPGITFQVPETPFFKQFTFKAYANFVFENFLHDIEEGFCFVDCKVPGSPACKAGILECPEADALTTRALVSPRSGFRPMSRDYLSGGLPRFVANRHIRAASNQATTNQTLVQNLFPRSESTLAAHGDELLLLYVSDNGAGESLQRTDINWMFFDGDTWSAPAPIVADTRAEFSPQVAFDAAGNAVAVWARVRDPQFNTDSPTALAAELEIVSSRWDRASKTWDTPVALTDNAFLDHTPRLTKVLSDGSILLTWVANQDNLMVGTADTATSGDSLMWARWDPASQTWSQPQTLAANLAGRTAVTLAGSAETAVYAWAQDLDGDPGTDADEEIFYVTWQGDHWGPVTRLTNDDQPDRDVRASVSNAGDIALVWRRADDLVLDRNLQGQPTVARPHSGSGEYKDFVLSEGPNGNLVLIWSAESEGGVDAHYIVYDRAANSWSGDQQLFSDPEVERSFAPAWDSAGNLTVAYNRVEMTKVTKTVLADGEPVEIEDVPELGRVDLDVLQRRLVVDLGVRDSDVVVAPDMDDPTTLAIKATVRNLGDLSVSNVEVGFYNGDPGAGGVEIAPRVQLPGPLAGAQSAVVEASWTVPTMERGSLVVVVDPGGHISEADETNNSASVRIGGADLAASLIDETALAQDSVSLSVNVVNLGSQKTVETDLALRPADDTGEPLATATVPALDPGVNTVIDLDIPRDSLHGTAMYTVIVDSGEQVDDFDRTNNSFVVELSSSNGKACFGDCGLDGAVTVEEVVTLVNVALGTAAIDQCPAGDTNLDGELTVDEIILAVGRALNGCE